MDSFFTLSKNSIGTPVESSCGKRAGKQIVGLDKSRQKVHNIEGRIFEKDDSIDDKRPIGFIDSGVGGLTVVKEALKQLPNENILYVGDTARCPYGPRPARASDRLYMGNDELFS